MDSRIREIEQWVAEAREGLCDGGREAYLRKLYLLEAEIRAVIKENGVLPEGLSPAAQGERVRRYHPPALAFSAAASVLVLAAASFYFTGAAGLLGRDSNRQPTAQPWLASSRGTVEPVSDPPTRMTLGEFLASQGEELVLDESGASATEPRLHEAAEAGTNMVPAKGQPVLILASNKNMASPVQKAGRLQPHAGAGNDSNEATDVLVGASPAGQPAKLAPSQPAAASGGHGLASGFNEGWTLSRALTFPEGIAPAQDKEKLQSSLKKQMGEICKIEKPAQKPVVELTDDKAGGEAMAASDSDSEESSAY